MAKEIHQRYRSAKAFADDLKRARTRKNIVARPISTMEKMLPRLLEHKEIFGLAILCVVFFVTLIWFFFSTPEIPKIKKQSDKSKELLDLKQLLKEKQYTLLIERGQEILLNRARKGRFLQIYKYIAIAYEKLEKTQKALQAYQEFYVYSTNSREKIESLTGMIKCSLKLERFQEAANVTYKLLKDHREKQLEDAYYPIARALLHVMDIRKAKSFIDKVEGKKIDFAEKNLFDLYRKILKDLSNVRTYPCKALNLHLVDTDRKEKEIILSERERLNVYKVHREKLVLVSTIQAPSEESFYKTSIASGDIDGDGKKELIVLTNDQKGHSTVRVFLRKGGKFCSFSKYALHSQGKHIWVGRLEGYRDSIIVGVDYPTRKSIVLNYKNGIWKTVFIDLKLARKVTGIMSVDVGKIRSGQKVILAGTGWWCGYDFRIYSYENGNCRLLSKKMIGFISSCKMISSLGKDPNIWIAKSHTKNTIFDNLYGEQDGIYLFQYTPFGFQKIWSKGYPSGENPERWFEYISSGKLAYSGPILSVIYRKIKKNSFGEKKTTKRIWLIRKFREKHFCFPLIHPKDYVLNCCIGNVDGDHYDEVLVHDGEKLIIWGRAK